MNIYTDLKNIENLIKYAVQKKQVFASRIRTNNGRSVTMYNG